MKKRLLAATAALLVFLCVPSAWAQVDPTQTITLRGEYGVNYTPRVIVLPMNFPAGDSIRAMVQRNFTYGNRIDVIRHADTLTLPARGEPDWAAFEAAGAAALVHVVPAPTGVVVTLYDVVAKQNAGSKHFLLPSRTNTPEWRWAIHGVSDEVHQWISRERGIAQTRIAFIRGSELWVVDFDGENERRIDRGPVLSPAWHPKQPLLAYSALIDGAAWRIGIRSLDGGSARWLTTNRDGSNSAPAFSPDGEHVYFQRADNEYGSIWTVPLSGQGARTILSKRTAVSAPEPSPDGARIIFVSAELGNPILYTMTSDGADQRAFIVPEPGTRMYIESPSWSPDGSKVAFAVRWGQDSHYQVEVADVRVKGRILQTDAGGNEGPSWAPDSRHIVFESTRTGVRQLWIRDTESGIMRPLTRGSATAKNAAWSPRYY